MAKMRSRTEALVNAYLNNYQNANAATVSGGQSAQQSAQSRGSAIMNATDKTLPVLKDYSADVLNGIVKSADNAQNTAISNFKLAKKQIEAEQKAAEKAAKAAAKSSGRSSSKKPGKRSSSTSSSTDDANGSNTSLDSLFGGAASTSSGTTGSTAGSKPKADDTKKDSEKTKEKSAQEKYLESKKAGSRTTAAKSYAEQNGTGRVSAAQPAQSRAVTRGGKAIGSSYAAAGSAPSAAETQAAKDKRNDYKSRQEDIAAALKKLQTDEDYRAELAQPGRKLTGVEIQAVKEYNQKPGDLYKQVQAGELSLDDYNKQGQELARMNQKASLNGLGQDMQAFTSGLMTSVPFEKQVDSAITNWADDQTNGKYSQARESGAVTDFLQALEESKELNRIAAGAGTMAGKVAQGSLFNSLMEGTPLAATMGKVGGKVAGAASKVPVLGQFATPSAGEALGRILTDQTADTVLDTVPSLVNDLQTYDDQQSRIKNGEQVDDALTPRQIGLNTLGNVAQNFAFNAIPEVGGAVLNRLKGAAGDAAQDALKQADNAVQDVQKSVPARNIVQPEANGTTGLAAQLQQLNTPDAANRSALDTLDELRRQVNLNGAQEKEAEQLRRAVLQRQQEIGDEAKLALQNSDSLPIDAQAAKAYNEVNGGVVNDNLGTGVRADVPVNADAGASYEAKPGGSRSGIAGQTGAAGPGSTASGNGAGVQGTVAENAQTVAEWAKSITGKGRQSVYTRRIENLHNAMQNGASRESLAEEAANIAAGLVKERNFAEPLDDATSALREYMKRTPIRLDEKAAGDILYTSGLKNIQQYNIQNGTKFSMTDGIPYDTAMQELGEMGVGVNGSSIDDLLRAVDASNAKPIVDSDLAASVADYYRDFILDGPSDRQLGADDFADWLDVQSFDRDAHDYVQRLLERDNLTAIDAADDAQSVAKLNGSESVPAHAVGAASTQYDRREVLNQDYANQRGMTSGLDDAHLENLKTENTHQIWTDAEAKQQAKDDLSTYIQQAGGDENKALDNAMQDLRNKEHWNKGDSATADEIRDRLKTQFAQTQPGTPEYYTQKARYEAWNQKRSQVRSEVAQTMQSFHGDASERINTVSKPITENWAKNNPVQDEKLKSLSDDLAKLKDELRERDIADMEREAMHGVFGNDGTAAKPAAGDMDAEFGQMLKDNGIPSTAERVANFSDADKEKYKTSTEEAYNRIVSRVKKLCEKNKVNIDDDAAKTISGKIMNGDNAESYYNSLIMQAAGISDLSIDEMEMVDDLYSTAAKLPDSKERYDFEQQAIAIMAQHLPAADAFEKWDNVRFLAMLGNTTTHAKNLLGNIGNMATTSAENKITALLQHTLPKGARTKALYTPAKMKTAAEEYIMNQRYSDLVGKTGTSDLTSSLQAGRKIYGDSIGGKILQKLTDINSGLLAKEDDIFVKRGMVNSLASNLTAKGLDESIFLATDARSKQILDEAVTQAVRDAAEMTYHIDNAATEMLSKFSHLGDKRGSIGKKIGYCITNGLLPFAKTTANITKTSLTLNPVGAAVEGIYRAGTHKGTAAVMDSAAKGIVGTGLIAFGKWAAEQGYLTGTLDADTKDYDEMTGKQEYSLHIPGVGSYTLDWLAPMAVPVMIGANLKDMSASDVVNTLLTDPSKFAGQVGDILLRAIDPISNMSIVQSVNRSLDNLKYAGDNGMGAAGTLLTNAATSYLQQYVPTMLGKVARTVDPVRRSSYGGGDSYTERNNSYLARSTINKIPGLSMNNEPYIDQWGREQASLDGTDDSAGGMFLRGAYNMLSPGYIRQENITPVDEYLQGLYGSTNDSYVLPEKASSKITVDSKDYYMTPEEKTEYAKTSGQTAYDIVDSLRQNDMFLKLPEDQQSALVQEAYSVSKTVGGVAAVGDGVSGTNSKAYEAYKQGGVPTLESYLLAKNATDIARDEKRETTGSDTASLDTVETWNTLYSQFGDDAVSNFVNSTSKDSTVRNISDLAGDKAVTAYMQAYSAVSKTLDDGQTPNKFTVGYGMQKYGLSGDDFARAYLAAYYKKDKNGKYPEKGGTYADKAGAEIYQSYGADALRDWVNYRATIPDTNGNGKVDKDEAMARLNEMSLTDELRRAYLTNTNKSWKNPY